MLGIAVLQPNKRSANIWWTMLGVMNDHRLLGTSRHEDLDGIIVIAVGALVERALIQPVTKGDQAKERTGPVEPAR
jgi:hypothetical protein